jgi:hypothetical protein
MAIDTLKIARRLREAGFTDPQAEAVVASVQEAAEGADLATKGDLGDLRTVLTAEIADVRTALKAEIADVRTELKAEIADVRTALKAEIAELRTELKLETAAIRSEMREVELRLEAKIEAAKADTLNRVFGLILGALIVNIVAMVGAMFGVAKLLGH